MANKIDSTYFDGLLFLDTSNDDIIVKLDKIIEQVEAEVLPLITYDENIESEDSEICAMLSYFVFALYNSKLKSINTSLGNVNLSLENGVKVLDSKEEYHYYNKGVDLFNNYVTDTLNIMLYQNKYGI